MDDKLLRGLGAIYTPPDFAHFLTSWAVQSSRQKVLDVGVGEGVFTFAAYQRLRDLGARPLNAQRQVFGAEIDRATYKNFVGLAKEKNAEFPNIYPEDFFNITFPPVDAVVGNPPYVRRTYLNNVDQIRRSVIVHEPEGKIDLSRLTDLYVYFLLRAIPILKPGGRLAVITADPWLNTTYGGAFKKYLQDHFVIESLVSLDRRVFDANVSVKPVLVLATKNTAAHIAKSIRFIRLKNGLPINDLQFFLNNPRKKKPGDVLIRKIKRQELNATEPWGKYFKAPDMCKELADHKLMISMADLAETRIGIQTLAKEFFVLTPEKATKAQIESEFLEPMAQSIKYNYAPTIEVGENPFLYCFHCSKSKEELRGTKALAYILQAETSEVPVRGKDTTVMGFHNKERINKANRTYWYDLKTDLERRGRAEILIPR
ncbi:MAG TPA: N-6 DNA methylase, partial [Nitrososphaera sp.]|nr:N-6 DNA methylase [Nitrososphaera sp.]